MRQRRRAISDGQEAHYYMPQENIPPRIASFSVDHDRIREGMYISRIDGDVTTFDLRTRRPNAGDYMDAVTMHTVEHLFATYVRASSLGDRVLYFGPMGCRTGFYLLVRDAAPGEVYAIVQETLEKILAHRGPVFGATRRECGNYRSLRLSAAKREAERYLSALRASPQSTFLYEEERI